MMMNALRDRHVAEQRVERITRQEGVAAAAVIVVAGAAAAIATNPHPMPIPAQTGPLTSTGQGPKLFGDKNPG